MELLEGNLSAGGGRDRWQNYFVHWNPRWNPRFLNPKIKRLSPSEAHIVLSAILDRPVGVRIFNEEF